MGYWRSHDWWGIGPGAHSHVDSVRWWNVLRPAEYAARLGEGESPASGNEILTAEQRALETVMLGIRERSGLELGVLSAAGVEAAHAEAARGRVDVGDGRVRLTREGRLFANAVTHALSV